METGNEFSKVKQSYPCKKHVLLGPAQGGLSGLALLGPGPAIAGLALTWPWPGLGLHGPAKAVQLQFSLAIHWPRPA